jgi:gliding motility-associated-like protein
VFVPKKENIYYIPNAFIPGRSNDPDINTLKLYGTEINAATLKIFNQWGQCIFVSDNPKQKGWDGKYNGVLQPAGTYVYGVQIIFNDGRKINISKSVNLIR